MKKLVVCGVGPSGAAAALAFPPLQGFTLQRVLVDDERAPGACLRQRAPEDRLGPPLRCRPTHPGSVADELSVSFRDAHLVLLIAALGEDVASAWAPAVALTASAFAPVVARLCLPGGGPHDTARRRALEPWLRVSLQCQLSTTANLDALAGLPAGESGAAWLEQVMAVLQAAERSKAAAAAQSRVGS